MLPTISREERAYVQAQVRAFALPLVGLSLFGWIAALYGFAHANPASVNWIRPYLLNPPDFSSCEPTFSSMITGHIAFSHVVTALGLFLMLVTGISRTIKKQWSWERHANTPALVGLFVFTAMPVLTKDFLFSGGRYRTARLHFSDFCALSWHQSPWNYIPYLLPWLMFALLALSFCAMSFVLSANGQWLNPLSDDPEIATEQLVVRLKYGEINRATFDAEMAARISNYDPASYSQVPQNSSENARRNWLGGVGPVSKPMLLVPGMMAAIFVSSAYWEVNKIYHGQFWYHTNSEVTGAEIKCEMSYEGRRRNIVGAVVPCDQAQKFVNENANRSWTKTEVTFLELSFQAQGKDVVIQTRRDAVSTPESGKGDTIPIVYNPVKPTEIDRPLSVVDIKQGFMVQILSIFCFAAFMYAHRYLSLRSTGV
jgi:hypothetical protein